MKVATGWRQAGVVRRALVLGLSFMLFTIQPTLGGAAIVTHSFAAASVDLATPLADLYDYSTGTEVAWTAQAEFDAGTYVQTNGSAVPGSVVLNVIGPVGVAEPSPAITWWDTDWTNRHCYTVDHTEPGATSVTEYQLRLTFPLETLADDGFVQGDFADLRAIATDGSTSLPLWVDDAAPDTLWVRLDTISAGASADLCIYYGYAPGTATAPGNHTELSVFSYTAPQPVYYAVSDAYAAPGSEINMVTFTDGNEVTRSGGTALNLAAAGDLGTFDAVGTAPGSAFAVLGPIVLKLAIVAEESPIVLGFITAISSAFAYLTVVGTPACTIVYASGYLKTTDFLVVGWRMVVMSIVMMMLAAAIYWPILGI